MALSPNRYENFMYNQKFRYNLGILSVSRQRQTSPYHITEITDQLY